LNIAAVIISYNSEQFLGENINALVHQEVPFNRIVVVDNFSTDKSRDIIDRFRGSAELIALQSNCGYARAANIGINTVKTTAGQNHLNSSTGEDNLILVANSDIILDSKFTGHVLEKFREDIELALLSPLILRFDRKTVDSAGQDRSVTLHPAEIGFNRRLETVDTKEKTVFSVCGAATVFRESALEKLRLWDEYYDEDFFMFWEDFDIGWRAHLLGLKTLFSPGAVVYHYRSGTLEKNFLSRFSLALGRPGFIKFHLVKNRYLTLIKNFRWNRDFRFLPFILLKDLIWVTLLTIGSPKIIIPLVKSGKYIKRAFEKRKQLRVKEKERRSSSGTSDG